MKCKLSVDVCLATFNGAQYIDEQITSILSQLPANGKILVSDDGSSDDTVAIIKSFQDERIVILNGPRKGIVGNFEFLLQNTTADLIFLCDQDDIWLPNRISSVFQYIDEYDLVVCNAEIRDADMKNIYMTVFEWRKSRTGLYNNLLINAFVGCCMCFKRDILLKALPFPSNIPMHDSWIGIVATCFYRVKFDSKVSIWYRRHDKNSTLLQSNFSNLIKIRSRLTLLLSIYKLFYNLHKRRILELIGFTI